jgi:DNA topoisomerase-1
MANKTLVIVESPAKAKTINKYLGKDYLVEASVGHIKDLVTFRLGVDVKKNFKPQYEIIKGKAQVVKKLKQLSGNSKGVLLATDPDREGEAIAWHIAEEIKEVNSNIKRVLFNEITKAGIDRGLKELRNLDENLFMSQQARRVLDRLIGYQVSPFLSRAMLDKTSKSLSAGRVQSVALRMICQRETEILSFVPIEYWSIFGDFLSTGNKKPFRARLVAFNGKSINSPDGSAKAGTEEEQAKLDSKLSVMNFIKSEEDATDLINKIKKENFKISDIITKQINRKAPAPFTTSSLQQEASKRLGLQNKRTMVVAQKLYEGVTLGSEGEVGLITYMRTDSVRLSPEAQQAAREHIKKTFGDEYLPDKPPFYTSKSKNVQDAHEAIRPTSLDYTPAEVKKYLDKDHAALYELIYNRFLASQMKEAVYDQTSIEIQGGEFLFRVTGSVITFKGYLAVYEEEKEDKNGNGNGKDTSEQTLPKNLKTGMNLKLQNVESVKSQTKPPARYNSASLVKELDELGIGRPSTYATIVSTLTDREYVQVDKKSFVPTELGFDVNVILVKNFPDLFNITFTAEMEEGLDMIAEGGKTYLQTIKSFYAPFIESLNHAKEHSDMPVITCDKCGAPMEIKVSRGGRFLGCTNYPECKNTKPLPKDVKIEKAEPVIAEGIFCDICGKQMVIRESRYGKFYGCIDYPTCKGTKPISTNISCPKCKEGILVERFSPKSRKKFWGCSRYPDCDYLTNYEPINKKCPKCGHDYIEAHFKKVGDEWQKYLKCPECKESFENVD